LISFNNSCKLFSFEDSFTFWHHTGGHNILEFVFAFVIFSEFQFLWSLAIRIVIILEGSFLNSSHWLSLKKFINLLFNSLVVKIVIRNFLILLRGLVTPLILKWMDYILLIKKLSVINELAKIFSLSISRNTL